MECLSAVSASICGGLSRRYWKKGLGALTRGRGYGSEALKRVVRFGFEQADLASIAAEVMQGNAASEAASARWFWESRKVSRPRPVQRRAGMSAFASHEYEDFRLLMPLYVCRIWQGRAVAREGQELAWVRPQKMRSYPMPPADEPLVAMLCDLL